MSDDTPTCLGRTARLPGRVRGWMVRWIPQSAHLVAAYLFTNSCDILLLLASHGSLRQNPRPKPRPGRDQKTTGSPICNLPMPWPVRSCRSHARASRAAARPGTTCYGARLGPVPVRPARLQHQRSSQALVLGTRSLGTLPAGCVSTIELYTVPRPIEQSDGQPAASLGASQWDCGEQGIPRHLRSRSKDLCQGCVFFSSPRESNEAVNRDQWR